MGLLLRRAYALATVLMLVIVYLSATTAISRAGTTGILEGTITDATTGKPIAGATIVAVSPSGTFKDVTDAHGFYAVMNMLPDTYTVRISATNYEEVAVPGVFVQQDDIVRLDRKLAAAGLQTIARVQSRARNDLVQPYQGSDVYNVSGQQLQAAMGTDTHETVYQYLDTVPGVTSIGGGAYGQPTIRGGFDTDTGYEIDGVPITERQTGFFSTNLTNLGISNVEVVTGGLSANNANNGTGVINTVSKVGTYPGYFSFSTGLTDTEFNHFLRMELGGATKDHRYSWYLGFDAANSQNYYFAGSTTPTSAIPLGYTPSYTGVGIESSNPGYIQTRDFLVNFHYRPDPKDDVQVLYLNSTLTDQANYGLGSSPNDEATGMLPCTGASGNNTGSATYGSGGVSPTGQACPYGLYNDSLASGTGNFLGHYSFLGKIQWNHTINGTSSFDLRVSQMYNKYIYDQPYSDPNSPANDWYPQQFGGACANYPYANGSPVDTYGPYAFQQCSMQLGNFYEDRHEDDYYFVGDYTWTPNENTTVQAGVGQEYDNQYQILEYYNLFNVVGTPAQLTSTYGCYGDNASWPCVAQLANSPSHVPYAYGQVTWNLGKFTIQPGLRWSRIFYGIPADAGGTTSAGFFAPSFVGTYRMNTSNVLRYSYSDSAQFVGSTFVYQVNNTTWDPALSGASAIQPALNHIMDLQWEHSFANNTSLRFGPYYRATDNYLASYTPFLGYIPGTYEWQPAAPVVEDNLHIRDFGFELGLNHNDPRPTGVGWWLSASYNNYWTQLSDFSGAHDSFINYPLAQNFLSQGTYVRGVYTPPLTVSLVADLHSNGWHLMPNIYWTYDNFYNTGGCLPVNAAGTGLVPYNADTPPVSCNVNSNFLLKNGTYAKPVLAPEGIGAGYWWANASVIKDLSRNIRLGVSVQNVFNMQHGTTPCYNYGGVGCYPYGSTGISGPANSYVYQNVTETPRMIELFLTAKMQ